MNTKLIVPLLIGAVIVGGGSFYGGMQYAKSQAAATRQAGRGGAGGFNGGAGGQGRGGNGGFTAGQVTAKDATSVTITMPTGGSKIIFYASSTRVGKTVDGTIDDIAVGTNVMVIGSPNSDGSITATSLQIRPQLPDGQGGRQRGGATSTQ